MKYKTIRELFDSFLFNYVPYQVRSAFASWFLDKTDSKEKEEVLEDIWDEMSLQKENFDYSNELPSAESLLSDADTIENPIGTNRFRTYKRLTYVFATLACICVILCTYFLLFPQSTTILVAAGSKTQYELPDGTSVWLNKGSKLCYQNNLKGKTRKLCLNGEAYFDVAKDTEHPFVVSTTDFEVKVLGTKFTLSAYDDSPASVYLESGKVVLLSNHFDYAALLPGEAFTYDPLNGSTSLHKEKISNHISWTADKLEFANATLKDIVVNLEHWYNVKINIIGDAADEHLSLIVRQESLSDILNAITRISGIKYTINGNEITIY